MGKIVRQINEKKKNLDTETAMIPTSRYRSLMQEQWIERPKTRRVIPAGFCKGETIHQPKT
jgi:hypothetical protein